MRTPLLIGALLALAVLGTAAPARAVRVTASNGSGLAGQTVDIPITVTDVTGLGIRSVAFDLTYSSNLISATDVIEAGTLAGSAGWSNAAFNVDVINGSQNRIRIATAGANALSGSGTMLFVRFVINPAQLTATSSPLTLSNLDFNEGTPLDTLANGTLTINATPIITVTPNTALHVRGETRTFTVTGSVTNPVSWSTTNPAVATIASNGVMTAVAPGFARVFAVDGAGRRDTTDGDIEVRGMSVTAGTVATFVNNVVQVPITVSSLTGLGIRSGQVTISYVAGRFTPLAVLTPPGTLLNGYGPVGSELDSDQITFDFAGGSDLNGSGVLCYLQFLAGPSASFTTLVVSQALFNEVLPAVTQNGTLQVSSPPAITVLPDNITLLAGQTQQFTISGTPTPPVTWSVVDPTLGTISPTGLFTAVKGGVTQIRAVDAIGSTDLNTAVTIYDFKATVGTVTCLPGATVIVPVESDRPLGALDIRSIEAALTYPLTYLTSVSLTSGGLVGPWQPNVIGTAFPTGRYEVTAAGAAAFTNAGPTLFSLLFTISPTAPNVDVPLTLAELLCNEGAPIPQRANGVIRIRNTVGVDDAGPLAFALAAAEPNPVRGPSRLAFTVPAASRARLVVYGADGRLVRTLLDGDVAAGRHAFTWSADDDRGARVPAGLYFARLEWNGRTLARKLAVVP